MYNNPSDISIERLLAENLSEGLSYGNDILLLGNLGDMKLFSHPVWKSRCRLTPVGGKKLTPSSK